MLQPIILFSEYFCNFPKLYILTKITKNHFGYQIYEGILIPFRHPCRQTDVLTCPTMKTTGIIFFPFYLAFKILINSFTESGTSIYIHRCEEERLHPFHRFLRRLCGMRSEILKRAFYKAISSAITKC